MSKPPRESSGKIADARGGRGGRVECLNVIRLWCGVGGAFGASTGSGYIDWLDDYRRFIHVHGVVSIVGGGVVVG